MCSCQDEPRLIGSTADSKVTSLWAPRPRVSTPPPPWGCGRRRKRPGSPLAGRRVERRHSPPVGPSHAGPARALLTRPFLPSSFAALLHLIYRTSNRSEKPL
uniref:Uncharacterized protein n=1 Tax=Oryza punctata TaxID=4537 RepID=A0A0E0K1H2_ORYPU